MKIRGFLSLLLLLSCSAPVLGADWVVARVSQPSKFTIDRKTWSTLKPGMTVPNRSWISTGPRGRVVLQRNKDQVTFQPGTLAGVFERAGFAVHTDFAQQTGTLSLSIDPQVKPHLSVQTPYLAAVVKGTVFSVTVGKTSATVGVDRGRVEVTDARTGEKTGVKAGQKASVDQDPATPMSLTGINANFEAIVHVPPFAPAVPAAATIDATSVSATTASPGVADAPGTASDASVSSSHTNSRGGETGSRDSGDRNTRGHQSPGDNEAAAGQAIGGSPNAAAKSREAKGQSSHGDDGDDDHGSNGKGKGNAYGRDSKSTRSEGHGKSDHGHDD